MSRLRITLIALLATATCVLALGGVALADSAGDSQYVDPLAGTKAPKKTHTSTSTTSTPLPPASSPGSTATPTVSTPSATLASSSTTTTAPTSTTAGGGSLPYTGLDTWAIAGLGAGLVAVGAAVRRRAAAAE